MRYTVMASYSGVLIQPARPALYCMLGQVEKGLFTAEGQQRDMEASASDTTPVPFFSPFPTYTFNPPSPKYTSSDFLLSLSPRLDAGSCNALASYANQTQPFFQRTTKCGLGD